MTNAAILLHLAWIFVRGDNAVDAGLLCLSSQPLRGMRSLKGQGNSLIHVVSHYQTGASTLSTGYWQVVPWLVRRFTTVQSYVILM